MLFGCFTVPIFCTIKELSGVELLELAEKRELELEEAREIDRLSDVMPPKPPPLDDSIVGTELEVYWRYWRTPTADEIAKGERHRKIGVKIWCEGTVTLVDNGTTTTENPENARCKRLAKAGAVRIKWPADLTRETPEPERALPGTSSRRGHRTLACILGGASLLPS